MRNEKGQFKKDNSPHNKGIKNGAGDSNFGSSDKSIQGLR